jgi:hypothetical protein
MTMSENRERASRLWQHARMEQLIPQSLPRAENPRPALDAQLSSA